MNTKFKNLISLIVVLVGLSISLIGHQQIWYVYTGAGLTFFASIFMFYLLSGQNNISSINQIDELNKQIADNEVTIVALNEENVSLKNSVLIAEKALARNLKLVDVLHQVASNEEMYENVVNLVSNEMHASQAAFFVKTNSNVLELAAAFALTGGHQTKFEIGEGLVGEVAQQGTRMLFNEIPVGYTSVASGLGQSSKANLVILPVTVNQQVVAVLEIATFMKIEDADLSYLDAVCLNLASKF